MLPNRLRAFSTLALLGVLLTSISLWLTGCSSSSGQYQYVLDAKGFQAKLNEIPTATVLDVRTPGEFAGGFIARARNVDWNSSTFNAEVEKLDKATPVFVYCLSGGRSASAATRLRTLGFKEVYELKGGILAWQSAQLPLTRATATPAATTAAANGYSPEQYQKAIAKGAVLVDFYADWCGPCKRLAPILDKLAKDYKGKVTILRVDADASQQLCGQLGITGLPTLHYYREGQKTWQTLGMTDEATLRQVLDTK